MNSSSDFERLRITSRFKRLKIKDSDRVNLVILTNRNRKEILLLWWFDRTSPAEIRIILDQKKSRLTRFANILKIIHIQLQQMWRRKRWLRWSTCDSHQRSRHIRPSIQSVITQERFFFVRTNFFWKWNKLRNASLMVPDVIHWDKIIDFFLLFVHSHVAIFLSQAEHRWIKWAFYIPWPVGHKLLSSEDHQHVNTRIPRESWFKRNSHDDDVRDTHQNT